MINGILPQKFRFAEVTLFYQFTCCSLCRKFSFVIDLVLNVILCLGQLLQFTSVTQ